ncbi:acyltransferase family protein [Atlantibacter hermannii]|uniref:acyltransferase family protein n=1 Tax=Atlantibacter hermannii TaxID=565 RepID=UPI00289FB7CE|nr:acyltransferase [Atlantibacter hermannii]
MTLATKKNMDIQALRAIAIIMVILQHYRNRLPSPEWYTQTFNYVSYWTGVDVFLAISGYLMCKTLIRDINKGGEKKEIFLGFFKRRIFRLIPCLLLWGVISVLLSYILQPSWGFSVQKSFTTLYTSLLGYSNLHFFQCAVANIDCDQMNAVTWSLSLEWQLYLLLAIIMIFSGTSNTLIKFAAILVAAAFLPVSQTYNLTIGWWIRPQAFFIGAIIFLLENKININSSIHRTIISLIAIIILLTSPIHLNYHFTLPAIGIGGALLLLAFLKGGVSILKVRPLYRLLDWIGDRSYSIYLCHIPMMHLVRESLNTWLIDTPLYQSGILYFLVFISLTAVAANFSYKYVESYFIGKMKNFTIIRAFK